MQVSMLSVAIAAGALFGIAEVANWRRNNRRDVDKVGFMPWRGIALASAGVALLALVKSLHSLKCLVWEAFVYLLIAELFPRILSKKLLPQFVLE